MRIDTTHRRWLQASIAIFALAAAIYVPYTRGGDGRPHAGSTVGLVFGCAGYGLMLFAALLGLRKRFPTVRLGRASAWMRGHLWFGFLAFPLLLFHSGFTANGPLTAWLMTLLILTVASGVLGAAVQHYLPELMTKLVPLETIYEEIPNIRCRLQAEADDLVSPILGPAGGGRFVWGARPTKSERVATIELEPESWEYFRSVYSETIQAFLSDPDGVRNECADKDQCDALFASLRIRVPSAVDTILAGLEGICEEERQLKRQQLIYRCLYGWLIVHVPLSMAVVVLGGIHAVFALRY
jgi:hypothetical protein